MNNELQNTVYLMGYIAGNFSHNKTTQKEIPVTSFSLAVSRGYRDQETGKYVVDFIRCVAWNRLAVWCSENLGKGDFIAIKGKLLISRWTSKETGEPRQVLEIRVSEIRILRKKNYMQFDECKEALGPNGSKFDQAAIPENITSAEVSIDDLIT